MSEEKWDLVIKPKKGILDLNLKQVITYFDLLVLFVKRDIIVLYKQTILGPIWFFVQPIMTMLIYIFVFGNVANISTDGIPKPLFYLSGIIMWGYFSECFIKTSNTFTLNAEVFGKVFFPRLIMPLSVIISNAIKFLLQFSLFLIVYFYFISVESNISPNFYILLFPILLIIMALMGLGFGLIFSSMTTKYKDLKFLIQFGVQLLMYATPIIYPLSAIPEKYRFYIFLNPITHIIETFKFAFIGIGEFSFIGLTYSIVFTLGILFLGIVIFNKTQQNFMDTV